MVNKLKMTERLMSVRDRSKLFHSSGYAQSQNRGNFGVASGESFSQRRTIDENRKFVRGYNNARVINDARAFDRVREHIPRTGCSNGSESNARIEAVRGRMATSPMAQTSSLAPAAHPTAPPSRRVAPIRAK